MKSTRSRRAASPEHWLAAAPTFRLLLPEQRRLLVAAMERRAYSANVEIAQPRRALDGFHLIVLGRVSVAADGERPTTLERGDFLGEMAAFGVRDAGFTAIALEPTECLVLTPPRLLDLIASDPFIVASLFQALSQRVPDPDSHVRAAASDNGYAEAPVADAEARQTTEQLLRYAEDLREIYAEERKRRGELRELLLNTVRSLAAAVDARDPSTHGHSARVARHSVEIARRLGLPPAEVAELEIGAYLHDVGKIGIRDDILLKAGQLDEAEWEEMRRHPIIGAEIIRPIGFDPAILAAVRHHHERFDGRGYPDGLAGEDIPMAARIVAVSDFYDAMTTARPYRPTPTPAAALAEMRRGAGSQHDPRCVQVMQEILGEGHDGPSPADEREVLRLAARLADSF